MLEVGRNHQYNHGYHNPGGELHIRKELIALKKARCLRDPATTSSWKSPVSAARSAAHYNGNGHCEAKEDKNGFKMDAEDGVKGLLHNWKNYKHQEGIMEELEHGGASDNADGDSSNGGNYGGERRMASKQGRACKRASRRKQSVCRAHEVYNSAQALSQMSLDEQDGLSEEENVGFSRMNASLDCNSRSGSPLLTRGRTQKAQQNAKLKKRSNGVNHSMRLREESYTPASTCSNSRNGERNGSIVGSWDGTPFSGDEEVDDDGLDLPRQGCGIPCYWSRTPKIRSSGGGSFSPSFSDSVRRKVSNMVSRNQKESSSPLSSYNYRRRPAHLQDTRKEGLPLLTDGGEDGTSSVEGTSDGCSARFSELDMEASCKLDRWKKSRCRNREQVNLALTKRSGELSIYEDRHRSLSQKYRPKSFEELVGQNMVVQTLVNAILRGKIAPVYLFQGPRGTGKTSTARIFAAALNCLTSENVRPCGFCRECIDFANGRSVDVREVDATNSNGMEKVKALLKNVALAPSFSRFKVFIIDECHMLASETWAALLKILEEPPGHVVFVLITTDSDKLPRTAASRCQKYLFPKIKDSEIATRLQKLAMQENLEVDSDALDIISAKAEGSLRDAETMLDQLSLLGQRITLSLVHELVGVVSDEKLLDLLETALSADTSRTVRRTRELIDSGIEPMTLMSQLATLIMDILAGSYKLADVKPKGTFLRRHALTEEELERLRRALKILSEAEKQLRVSNDQTTWLTAALLQFGSGRSHLVPTSAGTSVTQSPVAVKERNNNSVVYCGSSARNMSDKQNQFEASFELLDSVAMSKSMTGNANCNPNKAHMFLSEANKGASVSNIKGQIHALGNHRGALSIFNDNSNGSAQPEFNCMSPNRLDDLWRRTLEECRSNTLRQLLCTQGKLVSVSIGKGFAIVQLEFWNPDQKSIAERYLKNIANSIQLVLGCNVEIRINLASLTAEVENNKSRKNSVEFPKSSSNEHTNTVADRESESATAKSDKRTRHMEAHFATSRSESFSATAQGYHKGLLMPAECSQADELIDITGESSEPIVVNGVQKVSKIGNEMITDEQRLESAWLQAVEKCAPGLRDILKPEKNQVLPRDVTDLQASGGISTVPLGVVLQQKEGISSHELNPLKPNGNVDSQNLRCARTDHPESLCASSFDQGAFVTNFGEENMAYGSDSSSGGILCWKGLKYDQEKQRRRPRRKSGLLLWVVPCAKTKREHPQ